MMCSYPIEFELDSTGAVTILRNLPDGLSFTGTGLSLNATIPPGSSVTFDFGDGTGLTSAASHTYTRPGRYEVLIRIASNGRLTEYRAVVVMSRNHSISLLPPCVAAPLIQASVAGDKVRLQPSLRVPSNELLTPIWQIDRLKPDSGSNPLTFTVERPEEDKPRRYVLRFTAIRSLTSRFYCQQRFVPTDPLPMKGLHLATNRTFDVEAEVETTTNLNDFGKHVFGVGLPATLSPTDQWTLDLPLELNPCLVSVSSNDAKQHDLGELADVFLALEYVVKEE